MRQRAKRERIFRAHLTTKFIAATATNWSPSTAGLTSVFHSFVSGDIRSADFGIRRRIVVFPDVCSDTSLGLRDELAEAQGDLFHGRIHGGDIDHELIRFTTDCSNAVALVLNVGIAEGHPREY